VWLASGANQSETIVTFELPAKAARFGIVVMGGGAGTASTQGGYFYVDYSPAARTAVVGYHSGGMGGGAASPDRGPVLARVMQAVNMRGDDLKVLEGYRGNYSQCQALCDATAACRAWTYCDACPDTAKCCLKSAVPTATYATNMSMHMVSGIKSPQLLDQCKMGANHSACTPTASLQLEASEHTVSMRLFTDRTFAECYWQRGRVVMTATTPPSAVGSVALVASTTVVAKNVTVWHVKNFWTTLEEVTATPMSRARA
jgi:hypothetical protein